MLERPGDEVADRVDRRVGSKHHVARDQRVLRVRVEDRLGVIRARPSQHEPRSLDPLGKAHRQSSARNAQRSCRASAAIFRYPCGASRRTPSGDRASTLVVGLDFRLDAMQAANEGRGEARARGLRHVAAPRVRRKASSRDRPSETNRTISFRLRTRSCETTDEWLCAPYSAPEMPKRADVNGGAATAAKPRLRRAPAESRSR